MKKYLDPKLFLVIRLVTIRASMLADVVVEFVCVCVCVCVCVRACAGRGGGMNAMFECKLHNPKHDAFFALLKRTFLFLSLVSYTLTDAVYLDISEEFLMPILQEHLVSLNYCHIIPSTGVRKLFCLSSTIAPYSFSTLP